MNLNWRAFTIAFVVTSVINITTAFVVTSVININLDMTSVYIDSLFLALFLAGPTIGGLIAGYMVENYREGILNGTFPASLAITAVSALWTAAGTLWSGDIRSGLLFPAVFVTCLILLFPVFFVTSLIGPIIGVTIKKIKNKSLKDYNKSTNSNKAVTDTNTTDSTYTEKQISKSKKNDLKVIFILIVAAISLIGILEIFLFCIFYLASLGYSEQKSFTS